MRKFTYFISSLLMSSMIFAQPAIQINQDGTHTILHQNGNMLFGVNPDGTHSVGHIHGNIAVMVNSNGTHSIAIVNGNLLNVMDPNAINDPAQQNNSTEMQNNRRDERTSFPFTFGFFGGGFHFGVSGNIFRNFSRSKSKKYDKTEIETCLKLSQHLLLIYYNY